MGDKIKGGGAGLKVEGPMRVESGLGGGARAFGGR